MSLTRSLLNQTLNQEDAMWEEAYEKRKHVNTIFSDDEDDTQGGFSRWFSPHHDYIDPVLSSATYHIHQADNALLTLKHILHDTDGWKKALKHKSGVMVFIKNGLHKGDKTPIFKGEAIIQGFTAQAIFYVIGMRKLWDEQYEDGNLVENLNDTTSLTYESMKATATSKARDSALVEKIECTQNGTIIFACTSVESPKIPRVSGKTRANIKLLGWMLEPLHGTNFPATKVTYVIQESTKGWVPGFAKKSLARRPLVIAKVASYLEKKTERIQQQQQHVRPAYNRRPSVMSSTEPVTQKHIRFAETPLYPTHRHPLQKVEGLQLLKKLTFSTDNWNLTEELDDGMTKYYTLPMTDDLQKKKERKTPFIRADSIIEGGWTAEQLCSLIHCYGSRKIWDTFFEGGKTVERFSQKDYLVHWVYDNMLPLPSMDLSAITSIETDPATGTVYTATSSVTDEQIPPDESGHPIRAYTDLYGWVFRPSFDKDGRTLFVNTSFVCNMDFRYAVPRHLLQVWLEKSLQSIHYLGHYVSQYKCPPYIRRVAGKVIHEAFDVTTKKYDITFVCKHQPSSSYRLRKRISHQTLWCTDIRFHAAMFPHGLDISIQPEYAARVQVSFSQQSIKIFTTTDEIDGKQMAFTLVPLNDGENDFMTYRYNNKLVCHKKAAPQQQNSKEVEDLSPTPNIPELKDLSVVSRPAHTNTAQSPETPQIITKKVPVESPKRIEEAHSELFRIPEGYLLVPENQNINMVNITDELSFNGQQIAAIFIVMVICYYMGKFTACNS